MVLLLGSWGREFGSTQPGCCKHSIAALLLVLCWYHDDGEKGSRFQFSGMVVTLELSVAASLMHSNNLFVISNSQSSPA